MPVFRFTIVASRHSVAVMSLICTALPSLASCSTPLPSASEGGSKDGDPNHERAGANCFACHSQFKLAGTVKDPAVERIEIADSNGVRTTLYPNLHRNFFRHHILSPPFDVALVSVDGSRREMKAAPHGSCNACHHDLLGGDGAL